MGPSASGLWYLQACAYSCSFCLVLTCAHVQPLLLTSTANHKMCGLCVNTHNVVRQTSSLRAPQDYPSVPGPAVSL